MSAVAELERAVDGVPDGWRVAPFSDLADYVNGRAFKPEDWGTTGLPIIRIAQITNPDAETNFYDGAVDPRNLIDNGDLIFSWSATLAVMRWVKGPAVLNQHLFKVTPAKGIDRNWLQFRLEASIPDLADEAHGTTMKHIRKGTLSSQTTVVPPLDEQRRIAEVLRAVDEAIAAANAALTANETVHRLLLDALFGICFTAMDSGKAATIGQVCERVTYGFTNPMPTTDDGPWMLTAANVRHGWIDYSSARHTSLAAYSTDISDKSRPPVGSVLVTKDGTLGRVARVDRDDVCINQSVAVLIPSAKQIDGSFLSYLLQCPTGQDRMLADSGGSSVKHIYISKLAEMQFALPPMDVQHERAVVAEESERAVREQASAVEALSVLKSDLMSDLLAGRVRVPA